MKKYSWALLVAANCTTAQSAEIYSKDNNALELYGKIKAKHYLSENDKTNGDTSYLRMGIRGRTQINEELTGFGQWEYQYNLNNSEGSDAANGNKTRLGFAGLKHTRYGSIDYGRNYGVLYDVEAWTDMLPEFGGDGAVRADNYMMGRANGLLTWRTNDFFGLQNGLRMALQYQGKNDDHTVNARSDISTQNGDGFGASLGYSLADTGISLRRR